MCIALRKAKPIVAVTPVSTHRVPRRLRSPAWMALGHSVSHRTLPSCLHAPGTLPGCARTRTPTHTHSPKGLAGMTVPSSGHPSQPGVSLYLPRRQDAGRRWLHSCLRSPPLSPSGSAVWGPLCFQQVPWSPQDLQLLPRQRTTPTYRADSSGRCPHGQHAKEEWEGLGGATFGQSQCDL